MNDTSIIRPASDADRPALLNLAVETGLFRPEETGALGDILTACLAGEMGPDHHWLAVGDNNALAAAAYLAPEMMADRVWNLLFIAVTPERQRLGTGAALLAAVETLVRQSSGRLLLVETSALPKYAQARGFYLKNSFTEEARIRDYYTDGEDKVVFRKAMTPVPVSS